MFMSDVHAEASAQVGHKFSSDQATRLTRTAAGAWTALTDAQRQVYHARAQQQHRNQVAAISSEIAFEQNQLGLHQARESVEAAGCGLPHRLSALRFSDADFEALAALWNSSVGILPLKELEKLTIVDFESLDVPIGEHRAKIEAAQAAAPKDAQKSALVRRLAHHRMFFQGVVLMEEKDDQYVAHRLLFAFQNPLSVFFLPVYPVDSVLPLLSSAMGLVDRANALRMHALWEFAWLPGAYNP